MLDAFVDSDAGYAAPRFPAGALSIDMSLGRTQRSSPAAERPIVFILDEDAAAAETVRKASERAGWYFKALAFGRDLDGSANSAPSCLVLDASMKDFDSSLELLRRLAVERPTMPIVFVAHEADIGMAVQAMKAGALDFLLKPLREDELQSGIERAIDRSRRARQHEGEMLTLRSCLDTLTRREREVMTLVVSGRLNKQVADALGISEVTVKVHRGHAMRKMRARSFASLVSMASKLGLAAT